MRGSSGGQGVPTHSCVPSSKRWCFQIGTSAFKVSMSMRDASKASPRCADVVATMTAMSPMASVPVR